MIQYLKNLKKLINNKRFGKIKIEKKMIFLS